MTAKTQTRTVPGLLRNHQYSGTLSTILYNWPLFCGAIAFGLVASSVSVLLLPPWNLVFLGAGLLTLLLVFNILLASFMVYDWGPQREYDRLAELGNVAGSNVVIDVTCGKLRGTRGMLSLHRQGFYFVIDIYDPEKMRDPALRRARDVEPPLEAGRRIYRRSGEPASLPLPQQWADVIYCSFSLHELRDANDRAAIFAEFNRILKPSGKLLMAEHGRDWRNLLAFGLGVFSFFSPSAWSKHVTDAGLKILHHERWRGLVHLWVAERSQS